MLPFENLNNLNQQKSNFFRMLLLSILAFVTVIISMFIPMVLVVSLALITIPSVKLMLEGRIWESIFCSVIGSSILFFVDFTIPIFFMVLLVCTSFVYLYSFRSFKSPFKIIVLNSAVFILIIILYIFIVSLISQQNIIVEFLDGYKKIVNDLPNHPLIQRYTQLMGVSDDQVKQLFEQSKGFLNMLPYVVPSFIIFYIFASSLLNYYWSSLIFKKSGLLLKELPLFKTWDIHWYYVIGLIFGFIFVIIPDFNKSYDFVFDAIGINFLVVFGILYTVIGFAVLWGIFDRFKISISWRVLIIILISFFSVFLLIIPILGIIDIWFNFRKLERHY